MALVMYNKPNVFTAKGITLYPGSNRVADDKLAAFLKHPMVKARVARGTIEVTDKGKGDGDKEPTANELVAEAKASSNVERLRELVENDRATVRKAAEKRLAEIDAAGKDGDEE